MSAFPAVRLAARKSSPCDRQSIPTYLIYPTIEILSTAQLD
ncbi:MAG: hypothetical protein SW833_24995 [Cyanobacteriota bacterium]|nr:hypothetical protein [Cyanobacteriota bacterium]